MREAGSKKKQGLQGHHVHSSGGHRKQNRAKPSKTEEAAPEEASSASWYQGLVPQFLSTFVCDMTSMDCGSESNAAGGRPSGQAPTEVGPNRPAPFLYNDDENLSTWLPARLPRPVREDAAGSVDEAFLWEVLDEMNELRCNPRRYAELKLKPLLDRYDESTLLPPERDETAASTWRPPSARDTEPSKSYQPEPCATHEGRAALEEAITVLMQAAPARALYRETGMDRAAQEHAADLAARKTGSNLGHVGADGSKPADRLSRYGQWYEAAAEMLTFRECTARGAVASLVVCDGAKARHERTALLNDDLRVCGLSVAPHASLDCIIVITAAVGYGPRPVSHPARVVTLEVDGLAERDPESDQLTEPVASPRQDRHLGLAFEAVLYSVPLPHVHERVLAALRDGAVNVFLDYSPPDPALGALGRVHVSVSWPDRPQPTRFTAQWR